MSETMLFILEVALCVLAVCMMLAFTRAVKGPRFTDRIVAINMIGTMTTAAICILAVYLSETALIDVSLVYTLLSFLAVVVMCHVVTLHHKGRELHLSRERQKETEEEAKEKCR
ncbi:MAG: monovalent cation/H+ antiporter complex subunit F [Bacillota bacterium]|nr:monovalent cation/H+ antiporter complex subunit F [Bacillota bacterium]